MAAKPGDRITVYAGTYKENVVITKPVSIVGVGVSGGGGGVSGQMGNVTSSGSLSAPCPSVVIQGSIKSVVTVCVPMTLCGGGGGGDGDDKAEIYWSDEGAISDRRR